MVTDRDLRIVHVNTSWVNSTGYSATQCNGQFLPSLFYDGRGRSSNSRSDSTSGYHLKGGNSTWRVKSDNSINDMINHSTRPLGASSSMCHRDDHEVLSQLSLFRRLIRRVKNTRKNKKPRCVSKPANETADRDMDMKAKPTVEGKEDPQETLRPMSTRSESFGGGDWGLNSSGKSINSDTHSHGPSSNCFHSNNHSLVNEENWYDDDDDGDDGEVDGDVITANVAGDPNSIMCCLFSSILSMHPSTHPLTHRTYLPTHLPTDPLDRIIVLSVCLDMSTPTSSRHNSFSYNKTLSKSTSSGSASGLNSFTAAAAAAVAESGNASANNASKPPLIASPIPTHISRSFTAGMIMLAYERLSISFGRLS